MAEQEIKSIKFEDGWDAELTVEEAQALKQRLEAMVDAGTFPIGEDLDE